MKVERLFSSVYFSADSVKTELRETVIRTPSGTEVARESFSVPPMFSQLAGDIAATKYARKNVPSLMAGRETSFTELVSRIVTKITDYGRLWGYFSDDESVTNFHSELSYLLMNQHGAFNSPVWFNCGLDLYGISGTGGSWRWSENSSIQVEDAYTYPQSSACFILSREDTLEDIFNGVKDESHLFKYGSGAGSNFSKIRSKYEKLSGGGKSSGLLSFLKVFDSGAGATKSGGTTRRAAKMVVLDMDHPEVPDFINWKAREEQKAKILLANGIGLDDQGNPDFNGEAYQTVSGQNANNSVRITDAFMRTVDLNGLWSTTFRTTREVHKTYSAADLWKSLCQAAWECGDPGIQYHDTINKWHTCSNTGPINASNPCSEFVFLDDTACNLASLNLTKFISENGSFEIEKFCQAVRIFILAQEILVDMSSYPTKKIAENSHKFRPLGLGYANLGTLFLRWGIAYGSDEARMLAGAVTALMTGCAYQVSSEIAEDMGSFNGYRENVEPFSEVMQLHADFLDRLMSPSLVPSGVSSVLLGNFSNITAYAYVAWRKVLGATKFRNSQVTLLAPTGTIGLLMDCDTTGVEPVYSHKVFKNLAGGGQVTLVNESLEVGLKALGLNVDELVDYYQRNGTFVGSSMPVSTLPVFDTASVDKAGRTIHWSDHLKMMSAVQPFLSGAISKTVNMPFTATVEDISDAYRMGHDLGLKAVAIYRDGCKAVQPLQTEASKSKVVEKSALATRRKLPAEAKGSIFHLTIGGHKVFVTVGEYEDGTPGEVFIENSKEGSAQKTLYDTIAVLLSYCLQYGVPLEKIVRKLSFVQCDPRGPVQGHPRIKVSTSIVDLVMRVLGVKYLGMDELAHVEAEESFQEAPSVEVDVKSDAPFCTNCGHITVRNGTCYRCLNCGNSMGCS